MAVLDRPGDPLDMPDEPVTPAKAVPCPGCSECSECLTRFFQANRKRLRFARYLIQTHRISDDVDGEVAVSLKGCTPREAYPQYVDELAREGGK